MTHFPPPDAVVASVNMSGVHLFSKQPVSAIQLIAGLGVAGDAHYGRTVQHRSRVAIDPSQPNLRQVHLIHAELHRELNAAGFKILPGDMGENITTLGLDILALPVATRLRIGAVAIIEITGLRNPCAQLDAFQPGLTAAALDRDQQGNLIRKAGVMGIVITTGEVRAGDRIDVEWPPLPHRALERV